MQVHRAQLLAPAPSLEWSVTRFCSLSNWQQWIMTKVKILCIWSIKHIANVNRDVSQWLVSNYSTNGGQDRVWSRTSKKKVYKKASSTPSLLHPGFDAPIHLLLHRCFYSVSVFYTLVLNWKLYFISTVFLYLEWQIHFKLEMQIKTAESTWTP